MSEQEAICKRYGSVVLPVDADSKVGIALETLHTLPLNALRHPPEGSTCGWYIWGGEYSDDPDFFAPLHASHLQEYCPAIIPFLSLGPGWRVLLAPDHKDVWYDHKLLGV
jgi:hypothetical protein